MDLRAKYDQAIQTAKKLGFPGRGHAGRRQTPLQGDRPFRRRKEPDLERDQDTRRLAEGHQRRDQGRAAGATGRHLRRVLEPHVHGQVRRHAEQDCQGTLRQRQRLHEDLRGQQGSAERSRQDQAGPGAQDSRLRSGDRVIAAHRASSAAVVNFGSMSTGTAASLSSTFCTSGRTHAERLDHRPWPSRNSLRPAAS